MAHENSSSGTILYEERDRLVVRLDDAYATTVQDVILTIERSTRRATGEITCEIIKRDTYGDHTSLRLPLAALERIAAVIARWKDVHASPSDVEVSDELGDLDDHPF